MSCAIAPNGIINICKGGFPTICVYLRIENHGEHGVTRRLLYEKFSFLRETPCTLWLKKWKVHAYGANHDIYENPRTNTSTQIPRHSNINEIVAKAIIKFFN